MPCVSAAINAIDGVLNSPAQGDFNLWDYPPDLPIGRVDSLDEAIFALTSMANFT
jgi:hypothetical protein